MDKRQLIRMVCSFVVPPVLVLLLFTMAIGLFILPSTENALMQRKKDTVRAVVATATSIIERHAEAVRHGEIALAEAQQLALAEMRAVRFGGEMQEYLWITDQQPVMLMHPYYPELEGTLLNTYSDPGGKKLFVDAVELTSEHHEGFIDYIWTKGRDGEVLAPKLSYVKLVKPWGWVIGSGIYLDDVREEIRAVTLQLLMISIAIGAIALLLLLFVITRGWRSERGRYLAEEELIRSREQYRALAHAADEMTLLVIDGVVAGANRKSCENLGMDESELIGRNFIGLVGDAAGQAMIQAMESWDNIAPVETVLRGKERELRTLLSAERAVVHNGPAILYTGYPLLRDGRQENCPTVLDLLEKSGFALLILDNPHSGRVVYSDANLKKLLSAEDGQSLLGRPLTALFDEAEGKRLLFQLQEEKQACRVKLTLPGEPGHQLLVWALLSERERAARGQVALLILDDSAAKRAQQRTDLLLAACLSPERALAGASHLPANGEDFYYAATVIRHAVQSGLHGEKATAIADRAIDRVFQDAVNRAIDRLGSPPCAYALLAMGSIGRREAMLNPDQDTGVIYPAGNDQDAHREYFRQFGRQVTEYAAAAGLPPCKAGNCAENPEWCLSDVAWQRLFTGWINSSSPEDLLKVNIFFDLRNVTGDASLTSRLRQKIFGQVEARPIFLYYLAQTTLDFHLPADIFGRLRTRGSSGSEINLKGMMLHYVNFARIYTLQHGIAETNTISRLEALAAGGLLPRDLLQDTLDAWKFLLQIRFANQVAVEAKNFSQKNLILLEELSPWQESILKMAANQVSSLQQRLSLDFTRMS